LVILPHHTISPLPFHTRWKTNNFLQINRWQTTIPFSRIRLTGRNTA
jgi:hypothetical protein